MREIIARGGDVPATAVVEDGQLVEYVEDENFAMVDTIILGRVMNIVPALKAAFVDIGEKKNGFLPIEEPRLMAEEAKQTDPDLPAPRLQTGDRILVQVRREASGAKGAFLTRDISIVGSYVILTPMSTAIGVSSRITYEPRREELRKLGERLSCGEFGLVMRTSTEQQEDRIIRNEVRNLKKIWDEVEKVAATSYAPEVIYRKTGSVDALITDYHPKGITCIITDIPEVYENYRRNYSVFLTDSDPMADRNVLRDCEQALNRRIWLDSGANLVFDQCEAMTVIDVNTSKFTGSKQNRQVIVRTNLEACHEIARQIRLRNIGGIILIDMIDMDTDEERETVLKALTTDFQNDRVKTIIHGYTKLGLIEMTRRRTRRTLRDLFSLPCPRCHGSGYLPKKVLAQDPGEEDVGELVPPDEDEERMDEAREAEKASEPSPGLVPGMEGDKI